MKAQFEKIEYDQDRSWQLLIRKLDAIPFEWHFHPEFELTLTLNSCGERYIGNTISEYSEYDLVLLGPNIPHTWQSRASLNSEQSQKVYVLWFDIKWVREVIRLFPECRPIMALLQQAQRGVSFPREFAQQALPLFKSLDQANPTQRLTSLLQILDALSQNDDYQFISSEHTLEHKDSDKREQRLLSQLLVTIHVQYTEPLTITKLAFENGMSESTLGRLFKKMIGKNPNNYITQVRLGRACSLLIQTDKPISVIAELSGFSNLSNFNRLFLKYKLMTPKAFRAKFL